MMKYTSLAPIKGEGQVLHSLEENEVMYQFLVVVIGFSIRVDYEFSENFVNLGFELLATLFLLELRWNLSYKEDLDEDEDDAKLWFFFILRVLVAIGDEELK